MQKEEKLFNLVYYNGRHKIETIMWGKPLPLVKWKAKQLKATTHSSGQFKFENF